MRIISSNMTMASQYSSVVTDTEEAKLTIRKIAPPPQQAATVDISAAGIALGIAPAAKTVDQDTVLDAKQKALIYLIEKFVQALTGKKFKIHIAQLPSPQTETAQTSGDTNVQPQSQPQSDVAISFDYKKEHSETEQENFGAAGSVTTSDGKTINFVVDSQLSREYTTDTEVHLTNGKPVDPLVVNIDGSPTSFQDNKASFDLNSDGAQESIPFVAPGSGFLVVDKNGDGIVNDGSELVGAATGNAYQELKGYDSDNNGWIDEGDPIFNSLKVWSKTGDNQDKVQTLTDAGIGAISVGHVATPYTFKDGQNAAVADLQSSGVFLKEDGTAGTVQQVDLVV